MPSSIAHALFPAGCALLSRSGLPALPRKGWLKFLAVAVFLGNAPDLDLIPASLWPEHFFEIHRYWGHNIFSVTALIYLGQVLIRRWVSPSFSKRHAWILSTLLVASHLLLDSMGCPTAHGELPSIPFLYPFSDWSFYLPFQLFPIIQLHRGVHPLLAHVLAQDFWVHVIFHEIFFSAALVGIWSAVYFLSRLLFLRKKKTPEPQAISFKEAA